MQRLTWTAPTVRPLSEPAQAEFGNRWFYDGQSYETSLVP